MANDGIVVTGIGLVTCLGLGTDNNWRAVLDGRSGIGPVRSFETRGCATTFGGEVKEDIAGPLSAWLSPRIVRQTKRPTHLILWTLREALLASGIDPSRADPRRIGIIVGSGMGGFNAVEGDFFPANRPIPADGPRDPLWLVKGMPNASPAAAALAFGIQGPAFTVSTACSAGAYAIAIAMSLLRSRTIDVALAGGADAGLSRLSMLGFNNVLALSERNDAPERASRPFDRERDGFVLSEGGAMLVLENEGHARRRGAPITARMLGYGLSSEAYHLVQPKEGGEGMAVCIRRALEDASVAPETVDHVNAHGTSTRINDRCETAALKRVFGDHAQRLLINAPKSMVGHTIGGAGAIEAAITALSLRDRVVPPTVNYEYPDPDCDLFYTPAVAREAPGLRRAISNSFAFGGHNCTLVLERSE